MANAYANNLEVTIVSARSTCSKKQDVVVKLEYSNTGSQTIYILDWCLPRNELDDPLFTVTCNDVLVEYLGPMIKRREPTIEDVTPLKPGRIISTLVRISSAYDMTKTCNYSIHFTMPIERVIFKPVQTLNTISGKPISNLQSHIQSNNIRLGIEGRPNIQREQNDIMNVRKRAATLSYASCTTSQMSQISSAFPEALIYANNSFIYLNTTTPNATNRSTTWFGTFSLANWNTVKGHFQNITNVFSSQAITFDCRCTKRGTYAYVYPSQPYRIYLCSVFWSAPTKGTDSKAGTLIHETSHFIVVAGTKDYVYGQTGCKNLAISNSSAAIMNADSHEYFAENNPSLP
ncbi:unnamed protein product [Rotaria sp. Silwood2]|nr:unnamed protein product [Rotaria sp. Silwood2]CAF2507628.1 unnamed protein product [Rotaria sp. Silwood2]CAF2907406.1 unnamed protein product [Rotaria sp. Silwood2]CAF4133693.1 unnamed protein product [Rotaria sp. Silwood2]CAF4294963.1 unnamed protein product [Rotaria sp. Silwood2]